MCSSIKAANFSVMLPIALNIGLPWLLSLCIFGGIKKFGILGNLLYKIFSILSSIILNITACSIVNST